MKVEIKNDPTSEIDWSKGSQLVVYSTCEEDKKIVLTTTETPSGYCFRGIDILTGYYSSGWIKEYFRPFNGEVTLKND